MKPQHQSTHASKPVRLALLIAVTAVGSLIGLLIGMASLERTSDAATAPRAGTADSHRAERARLTRQLQTLRSRPATVPGEVDGDADDPPAPGSLAMHPEPEERFVPRPPGEWRGMLVNEAWTWACSADQPCTQARACVDGTCVACRADSDCLSGESCVLDHCVKQEQAGCRSYTDCTGEDPGALCVLSGITHGARRGNEDMRSYCLAPTGAALGQ